MRILYVEDDRALAAEVEAELARSTGIRLVRHVTTIAAAHRLADEEVFDVALVDLGLPDGDGGDLVRAFASRVPPIPALAHTLFDDRQTVLRTVDAGARGYLTKDQPVERLAEALGECVAGGCPLSSSAAAHILADRQTPPPPSPLTVRESDVIVLIAKGLTYGECAEALGIGVGTVQSYVRAAYRKLEINSKAEAALWAAQRGLV